MVNGTLMIKCKTCSLNSTHSTKYHAKWLANPTSFNLPYTHKYAQECAHLAAENPMVLPPA